MIELPMLSYKHRPKPFSYGVYEIDSISFPELRSPWPAVGKRELWPWKKAFQACAIAWNRCRLRLRSEPDNQNSVISHCYFKTDAPRALVFRPLVKENEALGTRLEIDSKRGEIGNQKLPIILPRIWRKLFTSVACLDIRNFLMAINGRNGKRLVITMHCWCKLQEIGIWFKKKKTKALGGSWSSKNEQLE